MNEITLAFDNREIIPINGKQFIINPLTEQIPATTSVLLHEACQELAMRVDKQTTKLLTEEDKGAILVAGVSIFTKLPFGMARWYPSGIANQIKETLDSEYVTGELYLNGIQRGDKVTIIDDMISTGGTMVSMVRAVKRTGAEIVGVICIAEKIGYGGVERVRNETGYDVSVVVKVDISGKCSKVIV